MQCFNDAFSHNYLASRLASMENEVSSLPANKMDCTDRAAWIDYFCSRYLLEPVKIYKEAAAIDEFVEQDTETYNGWSHMLPGQPEYISVPGIRVTCKVPFSGNPELFRLVPSSHTLSPFEVDKIIKPGNDGLGYLLFSFETTQNGTTAESIREHFVQEASDFCREIDRVNADVSRFNESLPNAVETAVDKRIGQLDKLASIRQGLNLPLNRVEGAPMAMPVPLVKRKISFPKPVSSGSAEPSYCLSDADYAHITEVIDSCCSMMEAAPGSYASMGEEQLRDLIRATLNTHYANVTGETFRNKGKTDIHIPFEGHIAYIGECKIWHGPKLFRDAIDQLFSYTTWRDTKVSIVVFNKENKSFETILNAIDSTLTEVAIEVERTKTETWRCKVPHEDGRIMHLTVQAFNLYS